MKTLNEVLNEKINGLVYGNRVLLPFKAEVLKIIIGSEIITDFSKQLHGAYIRVSDLYTEIYFLDYKVLKDELPKYEVIKMVIVEQGEDIFDFDNHIPLELRVESMHTLSVAKIRDDLIFFE